MTMSLGVRTTMTQTTTFGEYSLGELHSPLPRDCPFTFLHLSSEHRRSVGPASHLLAQDKVGDLRHESILEGEDCGSVGLHHGLCELQPCPVVSWSENRAWLTNTKAEAYLLPWHGGEWQDSQSTLLLGAAI